MSPAEQFDAIVIGSGLGGMSTAAYLAAGGKRTLVLEAYDVLGGSSHVYRRKNAWEFDVGVHYIGDCGPNGQVPTLLRGLGLDDRIEWLPLDADGIDTIVAPDFELKVPFGWDHFLDNLIQAFPGDERGLRAYIAVMRRLGEQIDRSRIPTSARDTARLAARWGRAAPWALVPHAALLAACRLSPRAALALSVQAGAMATTPQYQPVVAHAGFLQNFMASGASFPRGGGQVLAAGFAEVVRSHGGTLRTRAKVEKILIEGGRVAGVRLTGGEVLRAPVVVSAVDIKRTFRDLVGYEHLPRQLVRRNERWKMSLPLINACFGIEIDLADTPNTNYYVIPNLDDAGSLLDLHRMSNRLLRKTDGRSPEDWAADVARNQVGFVHSSTRRDPGLARSAPAGHAAIEVQTFTPSDPRLWGFDGHDVGTGRYRKDRRYQQIKETITAGMLDRIERVFPGASANVHWAELATPATQERYTHTTGGQAYGLEVRTSQFAALRPGSRTPVDGLVLAGTSTRWGPGTEGSMISGLHAASAVLGRDLLAEIRAGAVIADRSRLAPWGEDFDPLAACRRLGAKPQDARDLAEDEAVSAAPLFAVGAR